MINLSKRERWERIEAADSLIRAVRSICPGTVVSPDQELDDRALLDLFCRVAQECGMSEIASQLEGPLPEWTTTAIAAAKKVDFEKISEAMQVMENEGEPSLLSGFRFWPVSQSWDWLAEDFVNGYLPLIIAFCLQGWIGEFLPEDERLEDIDGMGAGAALAMSLQPYLRLQEAGWNDYTEIAARPLKALLAGYFDYTESLFLGEASRGEADMEFITWDAAVELVADYHRAEPVWNARPGDAELADPWFIFREAVLSFPLVERGNVDEREHTP